MLVMVSCLGLLGAFAWQGIYGHRNVAFRLKLTERSFVVQNELAQIKARRSALEVRVAMLRPGSMDADLVDEIARRDLNMGGKHDVISHLSN